ncbi:hypothetical protein [Arsenophonus nasoniae]|uniref:hypothetical protein n=1 Tax=Arsenophonus nasoniae TaxID=638 RepID=UPI001082D9BA|nr:hypothetical protein [Arsenophonus nasoniae]
MKVRPALNGLVSRDVKGALLSCQTGRWTKTTGLGPVSYHKTNSGAKILAHTIFVRSQAFTYRAAILIM